MEQASILVVEDDVVIRSNLLGQLKKLGYSVGETASNGREAVKKAEELSPALILMDIRLDGDMDGIEAAQQIHSHLDIPIVYLTAYADAETMARAEATEPFGYLMKPFNITEIHSTIKIALYKHEMERRLKKALAEKEVLLKEVYHRVKNNFSVISSLINIQSRSVKDPRDREIFRAMGNRVMSMAAVHQQLYQSGDLEKIDFAEYLKKVSVNIIQSYEASTDRIRLSVHSDADFFLPLDTAIPCGLIVNELVSNCIKHAFPGERAGTITITLHAGDDGARSITVRDDGVGLPGGRDLLQSDSLGMKIITLLVKQIKGVLEMESAEGALFRVILPADAGTRDRKGN